MEVEQKRARMSRLRLRVRPSGRVAAFVAAILTAFLALIFVMLLVAIAAGTGPSLGRTLGSALVAMMALLALWGAWGALREAFARPQMIVGDRGLTFVHPVVLKKPLHLDWDSVRAVAVSTPDDPGLWDVKDPPLEVVYERGALEWTAPRAESIAATEQLTRALVPLLDRDVDLVPNMAVVLNGPFDASTVTRRRLFTSGFHKTLPASEQTQGFVVSVPDPVAAFAAIEGTGLVRKLNWSDRALLAPQQDDVRRIRRTEHLVAFAIAYGVLALAHRAWEMASGL